MSASEERFRLTVVATSDGRATFAFAAADDHGEFVDREIDAVALERLLLDLALSVRTELKGN